MTKKLSMTQAKRLALHNQGLRAKKPFGSGLAGTARAIEELTYIQIDTIAVVERAHHHTLWTRVPNYAPAMLDELVARGKVFEYWSHAAAYLPMSHYRYSLLRKKWLAEGGSHWFKPNRKVMKSVEKRIEKEGPLKARDFKTTEARGGPWWDWKPAKAALERLFHEGRLMIARREGFEKVYDLAERVLPHEVDTSLPSREEYVDHLVNRTIKAHGFVSAEQIAYQRGALLKKSVMDRLAEEDIIKVTVDGLTDTFYSHKDVLSESMKKRGKAQIRILSPFDNSVIVRKRLEDLFDFKYRIECYTPKAKRQWGYFCLPILYDTEFVGRLDGRAQRKDGVFYVENLYFDDRAAPLELFAKELHSFHSFNGCSEIKLCNVSPKKLKRPLARLLKDA